MLVRNEVNSEHVCGIWLKMYCYFRLGSVSSRCWVCKCEQVTRNPVTRPNTNMSDGMFLYVYNIVKHNFIALVQYTLQIDYIIHIFTRQYYWPESSSSSYMQNFKQYPDNITYQLVCVFPQIQQTFYFTIIIIMKSLCQMLCRFLAIFTDVQYALDDLWCTISRPPKDASLYVREFLKQITWQK